MLPVIGNQSALLTVRFGSTKTWGVVAPNTTSEQTVTIAGLKSTDVCVGLSKPTHQAGLGTVGQRVSAADTLAVTFINNTAATITPTASELWSAQICRLENPITDAVA
jgi:hypothetical protein